MGSLNRTDLGRWLAIGLGVGIEILSDELRVVVARVRPTGVRVLGAASISNFRARPAAEWGAEYADFLKSAGAAHLAATVLLPRGEMVARQVVLAGVEAADLAGAVRYQIDSLHTYPEDDVVWDFTRLRGTASLLVAIAKRETVERYGELFAQAGVKISGFSFSAVALYSASRLLSQPEEGGFVALEQRGAEVEVYGESPLQPAFSALFDAAPERAAALAASQLRVAAEAEPRGFADLLPVPERAPEQFSTARWALPYATALAAACPRLALKINLLPAGQRSTSSRAMYIPTAVLAGALLILTGILVAQSALSERRYLGAVEAEIARLEPRVKRAQAAGKAAEQARERVIQLDHFRNRPKSDLDALQELTRVIAPPTWINGMDLTRETITLSGDADQAAGLLKTLDESKYFRNSEFTSPIARVGAGEIFRIRTQREGALP
jgi:Tfp pilus assembly protein PilN